MQSNGASAATQVREFDLVTYGADGRIASIQRPYAEIDYKTSGGRDSYNAMQLALTRRSSHGLVMNAQYTLGYSRGTSGGSNEARTVGNNARDLEDFEYDYGYNNFDVRHTFNLSALYNVPGRGALRGGWSVGGIANARSGVPINLLITRPDIVYTDPAGNVWNAPAADRTAVINTPFGGSSRSTRRPDVVPGVSPFLEDGGLLYLNPAAFTTPQPGTFGNLERNSIHGPNFRQIDMVIAKRVEMGRGSNLELRAEVFNLFNTTNFAYDGIAATLPKCPPRSGRVGVAGKPRAARPALHSGQRRHLRPRHQYRRPDRRSRHQSAGSVCAQVWFLDCSCRASGRMRGRRLLWVRQVRRFDRYGFAVSAGSPVLLISISRAPVEPGNLSNRTCRTYRTSEPAEPANTVIAFMIKHVAPFRSDGALNVIVETPRGSTAKFKYDSASDLIMLSRPLPAGLAYPHDWGFVPGTRAPDGDPLDVMVVWDGSAYPGVLIACRPIGVLRVEQTNRGTGARERNDRLLAVPVGAARGRDLRHVHDLPERTLEELEHFFQAVVAFEGKELALLGWGDRDAAAEAVEAATER